jgi:acetyl-CoA carboxylase biotin carboxyl carrier protein
MDPSKIKDLKDLQSLLELMSRYDLAEIELEADGQRIRLRKVDPAGARAVIGYAPAFAASPAPGALPALPSQGGPAPPGSAGAPAAPEAALASNLREVTSPLVGTFYRASSPEAEPYIKEGDPVEADTLLCIIEAMKVMNEIPAGVAGIVREILVRNGESVEYGQPLFRIEVE